MKYSNENLHFIRIKRKLSVGKDNLNDSEIRIFVVLDWNHRNHAISMLPCCVRIYYKMQLRSSVANGAAYPTCLTTVYALTNILFVGFRKKKRSITQKERKERGKWGKILKFFSFSSLQFAAIFWDTRNSHSYFPHLSIMWVYTDSM